MEYEYLFEVYPDEIQARLEAQERFAQNLAASAGDGLEFVIEISKRWQAGQTLTIAFKGGNATLHKKIANAATEWTNHCNLQFDFGFDAETGEFRRWSTADEAYSADIRISFDKPGYWSLVGTDSSNQSIVDPFEPSMNFGGFQNSLPSTWAGTVLHEFGHAIGFHHEHSHPVDGCNLEFRWEDSPGYAPTFDQFGQFIPDTNGNRPGIYTVLGGPPNRWPKSKVDHNLKQLSNSHAFMVSAFDPKSIMKYHFGDWMFRNGTDSHCFSQRNNVLSDKDKAGAALAYPHDEEEVATIVVTEVTVESLE